MLLMDLPVWADDLSFQPEFVHPRSDQQDIIANTLGDDFLNAVGVFPAELLVSEVDLNRDRKMDLIAVQKAFCSNHACTFHFLMNKTSGYWIRLATIESWAIPFVVPNLEQDMPDIIRFDHLTDDCCSCSEPQPIRLIWQSASGTESSGKYAETGALSEEDMLVFKPDWQW
ncbi:hypothetical protein CSW98_00045 [Vibrio sp. HA2012]|nr:hypothetical protein CSW98_00045 [Vibrio sp. HA2012]